MYLARSWMSQCPGSKNTAPVLGGVIIIDLGSLEDLFRTCSCPSRHTAGRTASNITSPSHQIALDITLPSRDHFLCRQPGVIENFVRGDASCYRGQGGKRELLSREPLSRVQGMFPVVIVETSLQNSALVGSLGITSHVWCQHNTP
jgi:hypothetical protein